MDFIVENFVWFIVGGVVLLMTIVGYLADKTDFASKKYREKVGQEKDTKDTKMEQTNVDIPVNDQPEVPIQNIGLADIVNTTIEPEIESVQEKEEDLYTPLNTDSNVKPENLNEDLYAPLSDSKNEVDSTSTEIPEYLYAPLVQNTNIPVTKTIENIESNNIVNNQPIEDISNENVFANDVVENNSVVLDETMTDSNNSVITEDFLNPSMETLTEDAEKIEMPIEENIGNLSISEIEDYDKIFPDDPVIIQENKDNISNTSVVDSETINNPEDIWKF